MSFHYKKNPTIIVEKQSIIYTSLLVISRQKSAFYITTQSLLRLSLEKHTLMFTELFYWSLGDKEILPSGFTNLCISTCVSAVLFVCLYSIGGIKRQRARPEWDEFSESSAVIVFGAGARCYCCPVSLFPPCSSKTGNSSIGTLGGS